MWRDENTHGDYVQWTKEKIAALPAKDIQQLRENALKRGSGDIVALCDEVLGSRPRPATRGRSTRQRELDGRPLVSRSKAFEMRGVKLHNPRWSWGGVRQSDGMVVFTVWAQDVEKADGARSYRLFGPSRGGDELWVDRPGGKERLQHCRLALERGEGEGLLIYGERRGQDVPFEEASRVSGADPYTTLRFKVEQRGEEYWAVWGGKLLRCRCCDVGTPTSGPRICPECTHVFQGNGWDGIDAHWRARHEVIMPYGDFWQSLCEDHRKEPLNA
mgnify:CR=1 FL=1